MSNETTPRRPDCVRIPAGWPAGLAGMERLRRVKDEFARLLGGKLAHLAHVRGEDDLVTAEPGQTVYFPLGHPMQRSPRHELFVAEKGPDGTWRPVAPATGHPGEDDRVKLGYLVDDPHAETPETRAAVDAEYAQRLAEHRASPETLERMRALGIA